MEGSEILVDMKLGAEEEVYASLENIIGGWVWMEVMDRVYILEEEEKDLEEVAAEAAMIAICIIMVEMEHKAV